MPSTGLQGGAARLLSHIEDLPPDAIGTLRFGSDGMIFVESRLVCWAVATGMSQRLTELLRQQSAPPLASDWLEQLVRKCQVSGKPIGEALVASGHVSEGGLRSALMAQTSEAIARISQSGIPRSEFVAHQRASYDPRFVFSSVEILASIGGASDRAKVTQSRNHLRSLLTADIPGMAFVREASGPVIIIADQRMARRVSDMFDLCRWISSAFDVATQIDPDVRVIAATWRSQSMVTWVSHDVHFAARCDSRAASATLLARLGDHEVLSDLPPARGGST